MTGIQIADPEASASNQTAQSHSHESTMVDIVNGARVILKSFRRALMRVRHRGPAVNFTGYIPGYKYDLSAALDHDETSSDTIDRTTVTQRLDDAENQVRESIKLALAGARLNGKRHIIRQEIAGFWYSICITAEGENALNESE